MIRLIEKLLIDFELLLHNFLWLFLLERWALVLENHRHGVVEGEVAGVALTGAGEVFVALVSDRAPIAVDIAIFVIVDTILESLV